MKIPMQFRMTKIRKKNSKKNSLGIKMNGHWCPYIVVWSDLFKYRTKRIVIFYLKITPNQVKEHMISFSIGLIWFSVFLKHTYL